MSERTIRLRVQGKVQGVGFRWYVKERARRLGLAGWVRNLDDGSVELAATGPAAAVDDLIATVRRGPPGARVDDVRILPEPEARELREPFTIQR